MRILLTGHLGYIGAVAVALYKSHGHGVTGLDVGYFRECTVGGRTFVPPDREIVKDQRDIRPADLEGFDAVIHLAGLSNDPLGALKPELTYEINLDGSIRLAEAAREAGVRRFVFASSCSIYGAAGAGAALDETADFNPVSAYAISKVKFEQALYAMASENFSPVYMRNATAFGVSARTRLDLVLNNLMAHAHTSGKIYVMSDGTPWRPLVHIEDISLAALCAATAPRSAVHNQAFNVGRNDANYQVKEIAEMVKRFVPEAQLVITGETGGDPRSYKVNFDKISEKLPGFTASWTLEKGAEELDKWMKGGGLEGAAFDSRKFIRLKQLQHLMEIGSVDADLRPVNSL